MWNLAGSVFIGCSFFVWSLVFERIQIRVRACSYLLDFVVQVGRGRHSGFLLLVELLSPYGLMWNNGCRGFKV